MRTAPRDLSADELAQTVSEHWALEAPTLQYAPLGFGSHHWHVVSGAGRWFLTVDDLDTKHRSRTDTGAGARRRLHAALATARALADDGLRFVVAPLPATSGDVLVDLGQHFVAALYPHVEGRPRHWDDYETRAQRLEVLELLVELHGARSHRAGVEDLTIAMLDELQLAIDELARPWTAGPFGEGARRLLDQHAASLVRLVEAHQRMASEVLAHPDRFVLTHGEPHPGNTLVTGHGVVLIDWDTVLVAPPERDLWTLAGDDAAVADAYTAATGVAVDPAAVVCYGVRWDLDEIAGYVALLRRPHVDDADVAESWRNLQHFLQPERRWPQLC